MSTVERIDHSNLHLLGKGFYNEFGIDTALGYEETEVGGWFPKIGIGLLKKEPGPYSFSKNYQIQPAAFKVKKAVNQLIISCRSKKVNGYAYLLRKEIELTENGFTINYFLENRGEKDIITDEYVHNFTAIQQDPIGPNYQLQFPFLLKPKLFGETVNPTHKVNIGAQGFSFNGHPSDPFFFSNLSGNESVAAAWELRHLKHKIAIKETGNFQTKKVNLWGWKQVISPELFFNINIKSGAAVEWSRAYEIYRLY